MKSSRFFFYPDAAVNTEGDDRCFCGSTDLTSLLLQKHSGVQAFLRRGARKLSDLMNLQRQPEHVKPLHHAFLIISI